MKKRIMSMLLVVVMVVAMIPVIALPAAAEAETNYMLNVKNATLDGVNTNGEYDDAYPIPFSYGMWGATSKGTESLRVVYSDDAIYVLLESEDTTETYDKETGYASDFFALSYSIGTSFIASVKDYRTNATHHTNQGGEVSLCNTWSLNSAHFVKKVTADKISFEAKFPVEKMNAADKEAFEKKTLSVKIGAFISNDWNITETVSGVYNNCEQTTSPLGGVTPFTFTKKNLPVSYVDNPKIDGVNTNGEYDEAVTIALETVVSGETKLPAGNYKGTSSGTVPEGSYYKVIYGDDGIYVFVNVVDTTPAYYSSQGEGLQELYYYADQLSINYSIGSSFIGKDWAYRHGTMGATNTGAGTLSQYPSKQKNNNTTGWTYEIKFPASGMTSEDKAAFEKGILAAEFSVTVADRTANNGWGWYDGVIYNDGVSVKEFIFVSNKLVSKFTGANVALGSDITVNYYAVASETPTAKFTMNGKETVITGVATGNENEYNFAFTGVAPQCMGDNIKAELIVGGEVVDTKAEYSVLANVTSDKVMNDDNKQLIYDLLAYGAAAQQYAQYKTETPINAGYEELASKFDLYSSSTGKIDGLDTNGEYDNGFTVAIDKAMSGSVELPSKYKGTSSGSAPAGSYYKVLFADDGIYVLVNMLDTTPVYYSKTAGSTSDNGAYYYADQFSISYKIGNSFIGNELSYRHGTMGATNTGAGTLAQYPGKNKDNGVDGWVYEIKFPVSNMTTEDQAAFAAGTLSVEIGVAVADNSTQGWGFNKGVVYSDNASLGDYTSFSIIDKVVGAPTVTGAVFSAAGVYHANANKIYAKVSVTEAADLENLKVTINGVEASLEETETNGIYIVYTEDVKVTSFDKVYNFVLTDGTNSQTLAYSINAYSIIKAGNAKTEAMKTLAKALYNYGVSAENISK